VQNWLSIRVEVGVPISEGVAFEVSVGLGVDVAEGGELNVGVKSLSNNSPMGVGLGVVAIISGVVEGVEARFTNKAEANKYMAKAPNPIIAASIGHVFAVGAAGVEKCISLGSLFRSGSLSIIHSL